MCIQLTCTHGYLYAFVFIKVCVDCADTHISYWYNLDMSNTWHIFYILIYTVIFIATIFFTFPRQHRFQKSNAKCNTKIYPVLCFSLNRNCAQPINLYRTAEEPEVDWWLWFDCDTFFMNMTATWFKPGNCIRVGREVCSEVRINFTLWRVKYVSIIGVTVQLPGCVRIVNELCVSLFFSHLFSSFATLWAHWISGCYQWY